MNYLDPDKIIEELQDINAMLQSLKKLKTRYEADLWSCFSSKVESELEGKDYNCGTVNIETDQYDVKVVIGKSVDYDQEKLEEIYNSILEKGHNPKEYLKVKYDVSETAFKNWPSVLQAKFSEARTVEKTNPKISFKRKGE